MTHTLSDDLAEEAKRTRALLARHDDKVERLQAADARAFGGMSGRLAPDLAERRAGWVARLAELSAAQGALPRPMVARGERKAANRGRTPAPRGVRLGSQAVTLTPEAQSRYERRAHSSLVAAVHAGGKLTTAPDWLPADSPLQAVRRWVDLGGDGAVPLVGLDARLVGFAFVPRVAPERAGSPAAGLRTSQTTYLAS